LPFIAVIIPAKNEQDYIEDCIRSLQNQTLKPYEIIIVNYSTDSTEIIARTLGALVFNVDRPGIAYARNFGAKVTLASVYVFMDADAEAPSWLFQKAYEYLKKGYYLVHVAILPKEKEKPTHVEKRHFDFSNALRVIWHTTGIFMMVRAKEFWEVGGFPDMPIGEDWEFGRKFMLKFGRGKIKYAPELFVYHSLRRIRKYGLLAPHPELLGRG